MTEFKYEIINTFGILSESTKGWTKEFKLISWNDRDPRFDIREWSPENSKMSRGITMSREELSKLKLLLSTLDLEETAHAESLSA